MNVDYAQVLDCLDYNLVTLNCDVLKFRTYTISHLE